MELVPLEEELRTLGVEVARPHALLAAPLVAIAHTERRLDEEERRHISTFAADHLALDASQQKSVRSWLDDAPPWQFVEDTLRILALLRERAESVGFENSIYRHVLSEGQELVRKRTTPDARERGEALLELIAGRLQLDLGVPWEEVAPEALDSETELKQKQDEKRRERASIRRNLTSRRLDRDDVERGGLV